MPRRTHPVLLAAALAVGLLLALGVAACGSSSPSSESLDPPPLTVGTGATLPSTSSTTATTSTTSTTSTTGSTGDDTGGAVDPGVDTGGAVDPSAGTGGDTGVDDGADTGGGTAPSDGGGDTTTPTPTQPANPGGAAPNYQSFCDENPGAC